MVYSHHKAVADLHSELVIQFIDLAKCGPGIGPFPIGDVSGDDKTQVTHLITYHSPHPGPADGGSVPGRPALTSVSSQLNNQPCGTTLSADHHVTPPFHVGEEENSRKQGRPRRAPLDGQASQARPFAGLLLLIICNPIYVPVDKILTPEETWQHAANKANLNLDSPATPNSSKATILKHISTIEKKKAQARQATSPIPTHEIANNRRRYNARKGYKSANVVHPELVYHLLTDRKITHGIELRPEQDLSTLEDGQDLNDNCLDAALKILAAEYEKTEAVTSHFSTQLRTQGWKEAKRMLPKYDRSTTLLIPMHTGGNSASRHWTLLIREPSSSVEESYHFYYFDSLNDVERAATCRRVMSRTNGSLYANKRDKWTNINCCPQQGRTCGAHTALNAALALKHPIDQGQSKQELLRNNLDRGTTVQAWLRTCIHTESIAPLNWIEESTETALHTSRMRQTNTKHSKSTKKGPRRLNLLSAISPKATPTAKKKRVGRTPTKLKQIKASLFSSSSQGEPATTQERPTGSQKQDKRDRELSELTATPAKGAPKKRPNKNRTPAKPAEDDKKKSKGRRITAKKKQRKDAYAERQRNED